MSNNGKRYSPEFKEQMFKLHQAGTSVYKLSSEYGIPTGTLYKWIKELKPVSIEDNQEISLKEYQAMQKRIRELEVENDILKKATAIFAKKQ
ncbi:MAG: transposase [Bacilli bacterium]|nr:transposase [Bacilli bacterium]MBN2877584.1 transposase [Bacilli bacterium]